MSETRRPVADDELRRHGGLREPRRGTLDDHRLIFPVIADALKAKKDTLKENSHPQQHHPPHKM